MSAEAALFACLTGHAELVAIIGQRVFPNIIAEGELLPAAAYSRTGTQSFDTLGGVSAARLVSFSLQIWGDTQAEVEQAAEEARIALQMQSVALVNRASIYDVEIGLYGAELAFEWVEENPS